MKSSTRWVRVDRRRRCPVCDHDSWCGVNGDIVRCMRVPSDRPSMSNDGMGWIHGGERSSRADFATAPRTPKRNDWGRVQEQAFSAAGASDARTAIAATLGVSVSAVESLGVGIWWDEYREEQCTTWPERDATGRTVGLVRRYTNGEKRTMRGSHHGLIYRDGWADGTPGRVWIVEGGSDAAAMYSAGLSAVGRPSNTGGVYDLAKLLKTSRAAIVILGENDWRPERRGRVPTCPEWCPGCSACWPGKFGAKHVAGTLAKELGRAIYWAMPPPGVKDAREWYRAEGSRFAERCEKIRTTRAE